jgi:hypothetical protein
MRNFNNSDIGYPDPEWLDNKQGFKSNEEHGEDKIPIHEDRNGETKK